MKFYLLIMSLSFSLFADVALKPMQADHDEVQPRFTKENINKIFGQSKLTPLLNVINHSTQTNIEETQGQIKKFIKLGADVNKDVRGLFPLTLAILKKRNEIVKLLVQNNVDVNKASQVSTLKGITPLVLSMFTDNLLTVKELLADPSLKINEPIVEGKYKGLTPLMIAVGEGKYEVVKEILEHENANPNTIVQQSSNQSKYTPLYLAVEKNTELVELLISHGAEVNFEGIYDGAEYINKKYTPLLHAYYINPKPDIINALCLKGAVIYGSVNDLILYDSLINDVDEEHFDFLLKYVTHRNTTLAKTLARAIINDQVEIIYFMLELIKDIGVTFKQKFIDRLKDEFKESLEELAPSGKQKEKAFDEALDKIEFKVKSPTLSGLVDAMLQAAKILQPKSDPKKYNEFRKKYLQFKNLFQQKNLSSTIARDLKQGKISSISSENVNQAFKGGLTPLVLASLFSSRDTVQKLIDLGADVNQDVKGMTPLYAAIFQNREAIVKLLIDSNVEVGKKFKNKELSINTPLVLALEKGNANIVKMLVGSKNVDINHKIEEGKYKGLTPLGVAISKGQVENVELLLKNGSNPNEIVEDEDGDEEPLLFLAMDMASENKNETILDLMLNHGADVNQAAESEEYKNFTPLLYEYVHGRNKKNISKLKQMGATIPENVLNEQHLTQAIDNGAGEKEVAFLLEHVSDKKPLFESGAVVVEAIKQNKPALVQVLFDHGAKANQELNPEVIEGLKSDFTKSLVALAPPVDKQKFNEKLGGLEFDENIKTVRDVVDFFQKTAQELKTVGHVFKINNFKESYIKISKGIQEHAKKEQDEAEVSPGSSNDQGGVLANLQDAIEKLKGKLSNLSKKIQQITQN